VSSACEIARRNCDFSIMAAGTARKPRTAACVWIPDKQSGDRAFSKMGARTAC
jgi:hypothetical protein